MKVFISWSGAVSQNVALALRDWLPNVLQIIEPYVSSEDIDKGARWSTDISRELQDSSFGILCITAENIDAPWVNFEAGALSKSLEQSRVTPFLFGVQRTDVTGPLLQFQSTLAEKEDVRKLVRSLNQACNSQALDEARVDAIFEVWWPKLEETLAAISEPKPATKNPSRPPGDLMAEILELVRGQQKILSDPTTLLPPEYIEFALRRVAPVRSRGALQDLEERWFALQALVQDRHDDDLPLPEGLEAAVDNLGRPISYLVRDLRRPTLPRRVPPPEPPEPTE